MEVKEFINKRIYSNIKKYILECYDRFNVIYNIFYKDEVDTIVKITLNDEERKNLVRECEIMFENLMYLYDTIPQNEMYKKLTSKKYDNFNTMFINRMKLLHTEYYEMFKEEFEKEIPLDTWRCIYVIWLINSNVFFNKRYESYKLLKFLFPKLFEIYHVDDFLMLMNIYDAINENKSEDSE
jgi:hypothetical protein